jgi:hypothetical protein
MKTYGISEGTTPPFLTLEKGGQLQALAALLPEKQ